MDHASKAAEKSISKRSGRVGIGMGAVGSNTDPNNPTTSTVAQNTIEEITADPIKCGFLLAFCELEYSAENLHYVVEVDRFHDHLSFDRDSWDVNLDYSDVDKRIGLIEQINRLSEPELKKIHDSEHYTIGNDYQWPSKKIQFLGVSEHIEKIWNLYLSPKAPQQICMPSKVLINTIKRLENIALYGGTVFDETLVDPIKTLRVDALPRFLVSNFHKKMIKRLEILYPLPNANELNISSPEKSECLLWPDENITLDNLSQVSLLEVLHDYILYENFVLFCKSSFIEENLYCSRAIVMFKDEYSKVHGKVTECPPIAEDIAWTIFRFFVAPKSVYEVSISHRRRKELLLALAAPKAATFNRVEKSVHEMLITHWVNFTKSKIFEDLPRIIMEQKKILNNSKKMRGISADAKQSTRNNSNKSQSARVHVSERIVETKQSSSTTLNQHGNPFGCFDFLSPIGFRK